jgi:hypothetical protein
MYTIAGFTVNSIEQAQSIHFVAMLKGNIRVAQQASAVIKKMSQA